MAETGPVITDMEHSEYLKPVWLLLGPSGSTTRPARAADRNRAFRACKAFTLQLWIGTIPEERVLTDGLMRASQGFNLVSNHPAVATVNGRAYPKYKPPMNYLLAFPANSVATPNVVD